MKKAILIIAILATIITAQTGKFYFVLWDTLSTKLHSNDSTLVDTAYISGASCTTITDIHCDPCSWWMYVNLPLAWFEDSLTSRFAVSDTALLSFITPVCSYQGGYIDSALFVDSVRHVDTVYRVIYLDSLKTSLNGGLAWNWTKGIDYLACRDTNRAVWAVAGDAMSLTTAERETLEADTIGLARQATVDDIDFDLNELKTFVGDSVTTIHDLDAQTVILSDRLAGIIDTIGMYLFSDTLNVRIKDSMLAIYQARGDSILTANHGACWQRYKCDFE